MSSQVDRLYLQAAVELARKGLYTTTPNPRVGCLIVKAGSVIGRGWHMRDGDVHAEIAALNHLSADASGATAYVSLEPCSFAGRTGACTQALIKAGIKRVVIAQIDPNPQVSGKGIAALAAAGIDTETVTLDSALHLNRGYNQRMKLGRPWVRLKCAISIDGRTAIASGESRWITGELARADVQKWRARSCAIVTGIGTVLADDPQLTVRDVEFTREHSIRQPLRVVLDSRLRTPKNAKLFAVPHPVRIYHVRKDSPTLANAECVSLQGDPLELDAVLEHLGKTQINEVLVEAGPALVGSFIQQELWDELIVYQSSKLLGSDAKPLALLGIKAMSEVHELQAIDTQRFGADTRTIYRRQPATI